MTCLIANYKDVSDSCLILIVDNRIPRDHRQLVNDVSMIGSIHLKCARHTLGLETLTSYLLTFFSRDDLW